MLSGMAFLFIIYKNIFMENLLSDELFCSLKNELREVDAQINEQSRKLFELIDQKKELSSN